DFAHPVESDSAWSESYYFNAYDPAVDAGLFTRIGVLPNEGTMDVGLSVWLPGDRIANVRGVREQHEMTDDDLDVGGVRYERVEPMRTWRITADADCEVLDLAGDTTPGSGRPGRLVVDLTFRSLTPAIGTDGTGRERRSDDTAAATASTVGKGHLEQAGTWEGTIALAAERALPGRSRCRISGRPSASKLQVSRDAPPESRRSPVTSPAPSTSASAAASAASRSSVIRWAPADGRRRRAGAGTR